MVHLPASGEKMPGMDGTGPVGAGLYNRRGWCCSIVTSTRWIANPGCRRSQILSGAKQIQDTSQMTIPHMGGRRRMRARFFREYYGGE